MNEQIQSLLQLTFKQLSTIIEPLLPSSGQTQESEKKVFEEIHNVFWQGLAVTLNYCLRSQLSLFDLETDFKSKTVPIISNLRAYFEKQQIKTVIEIVHAHEDSSESEGFQQDSSQKSLSPFQPLKSAYKTPKRIGSELITTEKDYQSQVEKLKERIVELQQTLRFMTVGYYKDIQHFKELVFRKFRNHQTIELYEVQYLDASIIADPEIRDILNQKISNLHLQANMHASILMEKIQELKFENIDLNQQLEKYKVNPNIRSFDSPDELIKRAMILEPHPYRFWFILQQIKGNHFFFNVFINPKPEYNIKYKEIFNLVSKVKGLEKLFEIINQNTNHTLVQFIGQTKDSFKIMALEVKTKEEEQKEKFKSLETLFADIRSSYEYLFENQISQIENEICKKDNVSIARLLLKYWRLWSVIGRNNTEIKNVIKDELNKTKHIQQSQIDNVQLESKVKQLTQLLFSKDLQIQALEKKNKQQENKINYIESQSIKQQEEITKLKIEINQMQITAGFINECYQTIEHQFYKNCNETAVNPENRELWKQRSQEILNFIQKIKLDTEDILVIKQLGTLLDKLQITNQFLNTAKKSNTKDKEVYTDTNLMNQTSLNGKFVQLFINSEKGVQTVQSEFIQDTQKIMQKIQELQLKDAIEIIKQIQTFFKIESDQSTIQTSSKKPIIQQQSLDPQTNQRQIIIPSTQSQPQQIQTPKHPTDNAKQTIENSFNFSKNPQDKSILNTQNQIPFWNKQSKQSNIKFKTQQSTVNSYKYNYQDKQRISIYDKQDNNTINYETKNKKRDYNKDKQLNNSNHIIDTEQDQMQINRTQSINDASRSYNLRLKEILNECPIELKTRPQSSQNYHSKMRVSGTAMINTKGDVFLSSKMQKMVKYE